MQSTPVVLASEAAAFFGEEGEDSDGVKRTEKKAAADTAAPAGFDEPSAPWSAAPARWIALFM